MASCKDCIHERVCVIKAFPDAFENTEWSKEPCDHFESKSEGEWLVSKTEQAWNNAEYPIERNCSVCGMRRNIETQYAWNYCPNCGAKMRGE